MAGTGAGSLLRLGFLDASKTAFFACDLQETFRKSIPTFGVMVAVANRMAAVSKILNIPLYLSEQYPERLGPTTEDFAKESATFVYAKTRFSMVTPELNNAITQKFSTKLESVVLFGLEAHVCVEQTAMDLLNQNIAVHILADGCVSRMQQDRMIALQRMRDIGCHITTSESAIFKLMEDKNHPNFKEISKLVRESLSDTLGFGSVSKL